MMKGNALTKLILNKKTESRLLKFSYVTKIMFDNPQQGVAPGQVAVLWDDDWCLGCGTIAGSAK